MQYLRGSFLFTAVMMVLAGFLGYYYTGTPAGVALYVFNIGVLGVLEVSLSLDNAVVNAKTLADMSAIWRRRFLTWGILIAVFGMRVIFPLLIVGIAGRLNPVDAVMLAATQPAEYERILTSVHAEIAAFGGAFLFMVGLRYFFDQEKDVHWVHWVETQLAKLGRLYMSEALLVMVMLIASAYLLPAGQRFSFFAAGVMGLATYVLVQWLEVILEGTQAEHVPGTVVKSGFAAFMYLEVLDASFSFDGVIGAFAISNNIFVIAIGLGIGAMFVRSLTVMMVEKGTLAEYTYLEHGAFWAILGLASCMFVGVHVHIPEAITGLIGAAFIGLAVYSSVRAKGKLARA